MNAGQGGTLLLVAESEEEDQSPRSRGCERGSCRSRLAKFEQSSVFQSFITTVIVFNTIGLALEADSPNEPYWDMFDDAFLYIYTAELALRIAVYGLAFFWNSEWRWNWFDLTIVMIGVTHVLVVRSTGSAALGKLVMAMRIMRLLRILRAFKIFIKFKALQRLGVAMVKSIGSVGWISLFFFVLVLVFSIFVTVIVGRDAAAWEGDDRDTVEEQFGSLTQTMYTLTIYLTLDDWSESARAVNRVYPWMEIVWVIYIITGAFMIMSLLTGLMADQMADARAEMEAEEAADDSEEIETYLQQFRDRFSNSKTGEADTGWLGCSEFTEMLRESGMVEVLDRCGVKVVNDAAKNWLFRSIDRDGDGRLTWEEFHEAFTDIGAHRDSTAALREVLWMEGKVMKLDRLLEGEAKERRGRGEKPDEAEVFEEQLYDVHARSSLLRRRLGTLESDLGEFLKSRNGQLGRISSVQMGSLLQ